MHLIQPAHRLSRLVRPAMRPDALAYQRGLVFRASSSSWSPDRKRDWILGRLREVVRHASAHSRYYRDLLDRLGFDPRADFGFADFATLPVLERETVNDRAAELRSEDLPPTQTRRDSTGGSTGKPTEYWTGPAERGWRESGIEHYMRRVGVPSGSSIALLWAHHLDPIARTTFRDRLHDALFNLRWFDCLRVSAATLERYHHELARWRPSCVVAYAGALSALAELVRDRGYTPPYPTRCLVTGAEKLLPDQRELVQAVFGRPVHERYGSRDIGMMGFQITPWESGALEIDWANVLVEPEGNDPDSPILVTKLHGDAMPMMRYRIGDLGRFPAGSAPGQPTFRLIDVVGRTADRLWLPDGRWVHGLGIPHLMKDHPVSDFQLHQRADLSIVIRVVARPGFDDASGARICETIRANLPGLPVELSLVPAIAKTASDKRRPVVSEVDTRPRVPTR